MTAGDTGHEPTAWLGKADEDLDAAAHLLRAGHWSLAAFHAQQAAEKALKAVQIHRHGRFDRIHDLWRLASLLKVDPKVAEHCSELSGWYSASRYPDAGGDATEEDAAEAIARSKEVVAWARTQLR